MSRLNRVFERVRPRMSPSLIIIGAQKAGTTSLYEMLKQHPKVLAPAIKEIDHFSRDEEYGKGMSHYRSHFPVRPFRVGGFVTFEASPSYLYYSQVSAERIGRHLPHATCLAILRDPVSRAYSAWNMYRDFKDDRKHYLLHDPRSFRQAVEDEMAGRTIDPRHKYLLRSKYVGQVQDFKDRIPGDRLLIHAFPELKKDPVRFLAGICERIGISPLPAGHPAFNVRANTRAYPDRLDPGLAGELYHYFAPEMEQLRKVLGYDIDILEK